MKYNFNQLKEIVKSKMSLKRFTYTLILKALAKEEIVSPFFLLSYISILSFFVNLLIKKRSLSTSLYIFNYFFGCIINGVDGRNFYQCHFLIKKN